VDKKLHIIEDALHLGLCLPQSCSNDQVFQLLSEVLRTDKYQQALGLKTKVLQVRDLKLKPSFLLRKSVLALVVVVVICGALRIASSRSRNARKLQDSSDHSKIFLVTKILDCFDFKRNSEELESCSAPASAVKSISGLK
jgi:hypothetical protein